MGIVDRITLFVYYRSNGELVLIVMLALTIFGVINGIISKSMRKFGLFSWRIVNSILAGISVLIILYYTIIDRSTEGSYAMLFIRSIGLIKERPELIREMIMNAFLFFPFGLCLPYAMGKGGKRPILPAEITGVAAAILSGGIELSQHVFGIGNAELSDIVMNISGAAIGVASFIASRIIAKNK